MGKIVEFKDVYKYYNNNPIVQNLNLSIEKGSFISIVGRSGSGKTTIMKMINGLVKPDKGNIFINGIDISKENLVNLRLKMGYSIQGNVLFPHMTVYENIAYVPELNKKSKKEINEIVDNMLELVNLSPDLKDKFPNELSGGQQQRVNLARAYANTPDILLMDEPFSAVDSITKYQLQKDLKKIHEKTNCTIIFITHDMREAINLSTHILVLNNSKIDQFATVEEILNFPKSDFVIKLIEMSI